MSFSTGGRAGKNSKTLVVETNDPDNPRLSIPMSVNVIVGLDFERPYLRFPAISLGQETTMTMNILAKDPAAVTFGKVTCSVESMKAKVVREDKEGASQWKLEVTYKPTATGRISGDVEVNVLKPEEKVLTLSVSADVEGDISVMPRALTIRKPKEGEAEITGRTVTLKANTGTFKIKGLEDPNGFVTAKKKAITEGEEYSLDVTVTSKGMQQERFNTELVVKTNSAMQPVIKIPVNFLPKADSSKGLQVKPGVPNKGSSPLMMSPPLKQK
ncbi:MAG: hypothetical protein ABIJ56_06875 [Pseudomonadota bacterium]